MVFNEISESFYKKNRIDLLPTGYSKSTFLSCHHYYLYFLLNNGEIVYIGQSTLYPAARIRQHASSNKEFDSAVPFMVNDCKNKTELTDLEAYLIIKYKPKYNQSLPKCTWLVKPTQMRKIAKTCGLTLSEYLEIKKSKNLDIFLLNFNDNIFFDCKNFIEQFLKRQNH